MYPFDAGLRSRIEQHLTGFARVALADDDRTHAAVAVCVVPAAGEACFVLTRRAARLRAHSRQWALPGGRLDDGETPLDAALRELDEEVALRPGPADVLGMLDDFATRSGYVITPVVVWCADGDPVAAEDEVESVHLVPLADLDDPDSPRFASIAESDAPIVQMRVIGEWIHAPTAAILLQLREVALHGTPTRVSHYEQPTWAWQ